MIVPVRRWWHAASGGRFYTWWSALLSLPIAVSVLGAYTGIDRAADIPEAALVSIASWLVGVVLVLPAAWAERRLLNPWARVAVVVGALVVASVLRPLLNDLFLQLVLPGTAAGGWPLRMATNVIAWFVLMSMIAVAVDTTVTATSINRRLRDALAAVAGDEVVHEGATRNARAQVLSTVAALRDRAAELRSGLVDFDRVREFSESVREASHDLDARAADTGAVGAIPSPSFWARLAPPPIGMVGAVFTICSVPYSSRILPPLGVVLAAVAVMALAVLTDLLLRGLVRGVSADVRGVVIVVVAVALGALLSLIFMPLLEDRGPVWLVALVAMPLLTALAAVAEGAIRRTDLERRWLTQALSAVRGAPREHPRSAADVLRATASILHGEVQGRCVVFAASLDDAPATPEQVDAFVEAVSRALDHAVTPGEAPVAEDPFGALVAAWSQVLDIDCEIDPAAVPVLRAPESAREVADIASEAFVNAVKHSAARRATVTLRAAGTPARPQVEVEVAAPGRLRNVRPGHRNAVGRLGGSARLSQRGADVVLAAIVPVGGEAT